MALITCRDLVLGYEDGPIAQNLNFQVNRGDFLCIIGENGSGKTNLLESIHYCSLGKSHRVSSDQNVIQSGEKSASCKILVKHENVHHEIQISLFPNETVKKVILIDHKKIPRFSELMGCLQCVIFSPEDLGLVKDGPLVRRRYLDMMISQINRQYFLALQQYRIGMEHRNAILRQIRQDQNTDREILNDFESGMSQAAQIIVYERTKMTGLISEQAKETYRAISDGKEECFGVSYHTSLKNPETVEKDLKKQLADAREDDIRNGLTSCGPHRDDLSLSLNQKNMKLYSSQGQIRTAALCLKLAQMKILKNVGGESPILLLDDVMSELDRSRRVRLIHEIENYQTFITCTDEEGFEYQGPRKIYQVCSTEGNAAICEKNPQEKEKMTVLSEPDFSL